MAETSCLAFNLILQFTREPLLSRNFYVCVLLTALFCFVSWKAYFHWQQEDLYFSEGKDIKSKNKIDTYFKVLYDISVPG